MDVDPAATAAVNRLISEPWAPVAAQRARDAESSVEHDLEGKKFIKADGGGTLNWDIWAKTQAVDATVSLGRPPGFQRLSEDCLDVRAPLSGDWSFALSAAVKEHARVRIGGENIFSMTSTVPLNLGVSGSLGGHVELDRSSPDRPRLRSGTLAPSFHIRSAGLFSLDVTVPATVRPDGTIELRKQLTDVGLAFGSVSASFDGSLVLTLQPVGYVAGAFADLEHDIGSEVRRNQYVVGDTIDVQSAFQRVTIQLQGKLKAKLKKVGKVTDTWSLTFPAVIPSSGDLIELQQLIARNGGLPLRFGETIPPALGLQRETRAIDFAAEAALVERGALAHLPFDTVVSLDASPRTPRFSGQKDSAIWTGHYLAAEALRYAAQKQPAALDNVRKALTGIERLYAIPSRGVTHLDGRRTDSAAEAGVIARAAAPATSDVWDDGPIGNKRCWYEWPEKGWIAGGRHFASYAEIPAASRRGLVAPDASGPVWRAWGCSDDWPVSRDQYVGVMLGVGATWLLVDDPAVKARAHAIVEQTVDYLLRHHWTIVLPPEGRVQTDFIGDFPKQLAFLRLAASVNPAKYASRYAAVSAAARHAWLSIWFSSVDPLSQYYKFNLSSAALTLALLFEKDAPRAGLLYAHDLLWGAVRQHRNAYFDLLHVLARGSGAASTPSSLNPSLTLRDEIVAVLAEWVDRRRGVPGPNGLPREDMSTDAIAFQQGLVPANVRRYRGIDGTETWQAAAAVPVDARTGTKMDFVWQRHPFNVAYPNSSGSLRPLQPDEVHASGAKVARRSVESPGVDYLLPYWLAVYLGVLKA